jgi:hypothetical protein
MGNPCYSQNAAIGIPVMASSCFVFYMQEDTT